MGKQCQEGPKQSYLWTKNINVLYTVLYNDPSSLVSENNSNLLIYHLKDSSDEVDVTVSQVDYSRDELSQIKQFCITQRNSIDCQGKYKMVIGTAWTLKLLQMLGRTYGEVVYIDATEGTINEERPLLTISTCTRMNKLVILTNGDTKEYDVQP
eukprot:15366746-Ditylum_brightwellii.AAC.4